MKFRLTDMFWIVLMTLLVSPSMAQESLETQREQERALMVEQGLAPMTERSPAAAPVALGGSENLFVGVDDATVSTFVIDPDDGATTPAFLGFDIWGAAAISSGGTSVVYFNAGADLYRWAFPAPPALCCTLQFAAADAVVVSAAYDPGAGELLFTRNIATEAVYSLPATAGACPATCDLSQDIVYTSGDHDFGGLAFDPTTGTLYGTNDDATPGPAGIYEIDPSGTTSLVVAYPAGETDIDALAFGDGRLYLVTDEPGNIYVYNLGTASFETPLANPWTTSELFSGAAAGINLGVVPVELETFTVD